MKTINAVKYIRPIGLGSTKPQLFTCDDGLDYVIKLGLFHRAKKALVNELIAYRLGKLLDLPLPEFQIIHVPKHLIDLSQLSERFNISAGPAFGSLFIPNAISPPTKEAIAKCTNVNKAADMIVFDYWINNIDRGGNNLIIDTNHAYRILMIDHGHSLYLPSWKLKELSKNIEIVKVVWPRVYSLFVPYIDSEHPFRHGLNRITSISKMQIKEALEDIPTEWKVSKTELNFLADSLDKRRFLIEKALTQLKAFFPKWSSM